MAALTLASLTNMSERLQDWQSPVGSPNDTRGLAFGLITEPGGELTTGRPNTTLNAKGAQAGPLL